MNTQYLKMCAPRVNEVGHALVELWKEKMRRMPEGACLDIAEDIQLCTMVSSLHMGIFANIS